MPAFIEFKDVAKRYKMGDTIVNAVNGVSFQINKGEFAVIVGPSGAGKSTVLNILGGMDTCDEGEITVDGSRIDKYDRNELIIYRRYDIGFVFQFYNLIPNLTAKENILLASELSKNAIPVKNLLESIGLLDRADHFPAQLSGGQQQRVAIARALAKNPDILLCDEPTGALDFSTGLQVLKLLKEFNKEYKKTVAIITHNSGIGGMADRVFHIKDGLIDKITVNQAPIAPEEVTW